MNEQKVARLLSELAEDGLPDTVDLWPTICAQAQDRAGLRGNAVVQMRRAHLSSRSLRLGLAVGLVSLIVLMSLAVAWPVVAQAVLKHVAPHEVVAFPTDLPPVPTTLPPSVGIHGLTLEQLQQKAGFKPLVPNYLPQGCALGESWFDPLPQMVHLQYSCVRVSMQRAEGRVAQPRVQTGAAHVVIVGDQPAYYVDGAWVVAREQVNGTWVPRPEYETPQWSQGPKQLVFERNGLIVILSVPDDRLTKDELIKIGASLQPGLGG